MSKSFMNFQVDEETRMMLEELSVKHHRSMSELIRWLIREEYERVKEAEQETA